MAKDLKGYADGMWWPVAVVSVALVLFGFVTLFYPGMTLASLVGVFAVFVVVYGLVEMFDGFNAMGKRNKWWLSLGVGVLMVGLGVYLAKHPGMSVDTFAILVGWTLLLRGIADILVGLFYSNEGHQLHWYITGMLGVVAGLVTWSSPADSALVFTWVLGLWALLTGVVTLSRVLAAKALTE